MPKNILEDLTLVVPTYFRQHYALRLMKYWSNKGPKVIVVDGTDKPISKENLEGMCSSIIYVHNPVGMYERLHGVLSLITTKYVALAGDDEFYIPSAVVKCIEELEKEPDLVACCGMAIGFYPTQNFVRGIQMYPKLFRYEISESAPKDRVVKHMSDYEVNQIYAVCRSREWKIAFLGILEREFPVFAIGEYQFQLYMSFAGKSKVINELMWLRNSGETKPIRGTDPSLGPHLFFDWYNDKNSNKEKSELLDISANTLKNLSTTHDYDSCRIIAEAGFSSFNNWLKVNRTTMQFLLASPLIKLIKKISPSPLKKAFRFFLNKIYIIKNEKDKSQDEISLIDLAKKIESDLRVKVDFNELYKIEAILSQNQVTLKSKG